VTTLEHRVEDALLDRDMRESEHRVKETVADALSTFDPSASVRVTSYFNHTFAPDMVLSWGKAERSVFLRFTDNLHELSEDIDLLDRDDPLVFGLSTPSMDAVKETRLDERTRAADILLTTPSAVDELSSRGTLAATDRMLRNSLAHGGRGALIGPAEANGLADTFDNGFTAASRGQVGGTRLALNAISEYFADGQARRLNRVVQAVWEGGGSRLDQYPGDPELSAEVGDLSLIYLLQYMDPPNPAFWRGVGRTLNLEQLFALAKADVAGHESFQHLVNANLDVLRARACMVLDMSMYDSEAPPALRWGVDLPLRDTSPALTLRGPAFQAFVTRRKDELQPRLPAGAGGLSVADFVERTATAHVAAVNASVGGSHITLSDDSGTTHTDFVKAATSGLPNTQVDRATVSTLSGRVAVDFAQRCGTAVTRSDTLAADLLIATTSLLVDLNVEQRELLTTFLTITARSAEPLPETLNFDEDVEAFDDTTGLGSRE